MREEPVAEGGASGELCEAQGGSASRVRHLSTRQIENVVHLSLQTRWQEMSVEGL